MKRRWWPWIALVAGVVACLIGWYVVAGRSPQPMEPAEGRAAPLARLAREHPPGDRRVVVLGLDGLDWDLVLPWVEAGRMPKLGRLLEAGTWGTLESSQPMLSPLLWTTIATGVSPRKHRILDFVERDPASGRLVPVSARSRQAPALWTVASALGRRVGVVGWWATWPAEAVNGVVVTDRLYVTLGQSDSASSQGVATGLVSPQSRTAEFVKLRRQAVAAVDYATVRRYMPISRSAWQGAIQAGRGMEDPIDGLRRVLAATRTYMEAGLRLLEEEFHLTMVYLEGTDTIGHLLAPYMPPPVDTEVTTATAARYAQAVPRYFETVDDWIGRLLARCPLRECTWLVVSDHGFAWAEDRPRGLTEHTGRTAALWHQPDGVFVLAGRGVEARGRISTRGSIYDVTPTVAALLGIPAGLTWRGEPLPGAPARASVGQPLAYTELLPATDLPEAAGGDAAQSAEFLRRLEALGYLADTEQKTVATAPTLGALSNLGVLLLEEGDMSGAERLFERAVRLYPEAALGYYNLRLVLTRQGRLDAAERRLWQAVEHGWYDPAGLVLETASEYRRDGKEERAEALLAEAKRRLAEDRVFWLRLLGARTVSGDCRKGLVEARTAARRFAEAPRTHGLHGLLAMCAGATDEARRALQRSLAMNPDQPPLREALAHLP